MRVERGERIYRYIADNYGTDFRNVLEIGCAAGAILYYFKEQGCEITGVDLGSEYVEYGKKRGLNLKQCHSSELVAEGKKFDLIIVNHVIEHFLTFDKELESIHQLLAEDGVLYVEVPGIKNLVRSYNNDFMLYLQNAHVYDFTLGTLERVMNKYGFSLIAGDETVRSLWRFTGEKKLDGKNYFYETISFLQQLEALREEKEWKALASLGEINECLVAELKLFKDNLEVRRFAEGAQLERIVEMVNKEIGLINVVLEALNRNKQRVDELEFNDCMNMFNRALGEMTADGLIRATKELVPIFEKIGVGVRDAMK